MVSLQGARQTGKSYLARELLPSVLKNVGYESLDSLAKKDAAATRPETFLSEFEGKKPMVIDEAQKAPPLFDEIKLRVDRRRVPGSYLLLGSTEFSKETLIRESLTGRLSRVRIHPMNLAETLELPPNDSSHPLLIREKVRVSRAQWIQFLRRGGMPGIFAVRSDSERSNLFKDWLDLTTQRDIPLIPQLKLDPDLCLRILELVATSDEATEGHIAKVLKRDLRRIKSHMKGLSILFVVNKVEPHPSGTGKPVFFILDVGLAKSLGASHERLIQTWLIQEQLSQRSCRNNRDSKVYFYRTAKGSLIDLVVENSIGVHSLKIHAEEKISEIDMRVISSFRAKVKREGQDVVLGATRFSEKGSGIEVYPWESLG